jgi:hypothetical protein
VRISVPGFPGFPDFPPDFPGFPRISPDFPLVEKSTGRAFALVDTDDTAAWREHVEMATKALAKDWLKVMHGEPLPDW